MWAGFALGEAALASGAADEALERFTRLDALLGRTRFDDVDVHPGPELAECLVLVGRPDDARAVVDDYARRARAKGRPWALARAARAEALLVEPGRIDDVFGEAARQHALTADLFETARTRLLHGQRLRRSRRRADAREPLRDALEAFERLGAVPWADRAAEELDATGADGGAARCQRPRRAQPARAADRRAGDRGADDAGDRAAAVPQPEDRGVPPAQRVRAARHHLTGRARGPGARGAVGARDGIRSSSMTPNPPRVDPALVPALRADLVASRYTVAGVTELLGPMALAALDRDQALPAQRVTAAATTTGATLVRLFALGDPVDIAEAAAALPVPRRRRRGAARSRRPRG